MSYGYTTHDRLDRYMSQRFGRDLSGGADWSTEGAWKVAHMDPPFSALFDPISGFYVVREARGGIGLDVWTLVLREYCRRTGSVYDTDVTTDRKLSTVLRLGGYLDGGWPGSE